MVRLANQPRGNSADNSQSVYTSEEKEIALAEADMATIENEEKSGHRPVNGCPECGGILLELQEAESATVSLPDWACRFFCIALLVQAEALEEALWG